MDLKVVVRRGFSPLLAVTISLMVGGLLVALTGASPVAAAREVMAAGFTCDPGFCNFAGTITLASPIVLCALGAAVVLRSGLFSIGQEGQYALGGLTAAVVGYQVALPPGLHQVVTLIAAALVGAFWGLIPAVLRVLFRVNELIVSIILNALAAMLLNYLVNYPLRSETSTVGYTHSVRESARLPLFDPSTKFGVGFVIALVAVGAVWFLLSRTTVGYEQRMAGEAPAFARYTGMPERRAMVRAAAIGGALAGLGGGVQVLGVNYRVIEGFSDGTGLIGLTAAILGGTAALGAALASVLYAGIIVGAINGLQVGLGIPREIGSTVLALTILVVAVQGPVLTRVELVVARRAAARASTRSAAAPPVSESVH